MNLYSFFSRITTFILIVFVCGSLSAQLRSIELLDDNIFPTVEALPNGDHVSFRSSRIVKYDSNLNEKDLAVIPFPYDHISYDQYTIGHDGYYYLYYGFNLMFDSVGVLMKMSSSGDIVWENDSLKKRGQNLTFYGESKLVQYGNDVFVFDLFRESVTDTSRYGVTHLDAQTGEVKSFNMIDMPLSFFNSGRAFYNEKWYFPASLDMAGGNEGMLVFDVDGSYNYKPSGFPAGSIIATTHDGIFSIDTQYGTPKDFSQLNKVNFDVSLQNSYSLVPTNKYPNDNFSLKINNGVFSDKYGIILQGNYSITDTLWPNEDPWIGQMNPENGNIVWDTVFENGQYDYPILSCNGEQVFMKVVKDYYELKFEELNFNTVLSDDKIEEKQTELKIYPNPT
ncbi:hypothetical protein, partial [Salibacter halophilus]